MARLIGVSLSALLLLAAADMVFAHEGAGVAGGWWSGFTHPLLGPDHVAAMVAVGLWGVFLGTPAIWILPVVFPLVMALVGALGIAVGAALCLVDVVGLISRATRHWQRARRARHRIVDRRQRVARAEPGPVRQPGIARQSLAGR